MCPDALSTDGDGRDISPGTDAVAIVTGGSQGVGREVVRMLAGRGYAIVVVYLDDQPSAEDTIEEVFGWGGTAVAVRADVTDELDVERLFDETIAAFGEVAAVVHATMRSAAVLYRHAAQQLRRGSAIVSVATADSITSELAREFQQRDITVIEFSPGADGPHADQGVADVISFLDRRRARPA